MKKLALTVLVAGSAFLASCANYATKEYVDAEIAKVNDRVSVVESKLSALEKEVASLKGQSGSAAGLSERVANLESRINEMKNTCPSACSDRINALEKEVAGLKDKVEKQTKVMEQEVEKKHAKVVSSREKIPVEATLIEQEGEYIILLEKRGGKRR